MQSRLAKPGHVLHSLHYSSVMIPFDASMGTHTLSARRRSVGVDNCVSHVQNATLPHRNTKHLANLAIITYQWYTTRLRMGGIWRSTTWPSLANVTFHPRPVLLPFRRMDGPQNGTPDPTSCVQLTLLGQTRFDGSITLMFHGKAHRDMLTEAYDRDYLPRYRRRQIVTTE